MLCVGDYGFTIPLLGDREPARFVRVGVGGQGGKEVHMLLEEFALKMSSTYFIELTTYCIQFQMCTICFSTSSMKFLTCSMKFQT